MTRAAHWTDTELTDAPRRRRLLERMHQRFERLYGAPVASDCLRRLKLLVNRYEDQLCILPRGQRWTEADNVLITYGDMVHRPGEMPLVTLEGFLRRRLGGLIDTVHLLPFFPWSSDDGFSVTDYRAVDPALGGWEDIHRIGTRFRLMFDLVLNHCSRQSHWFRDYVTGIAPQRHYFIEVEPGTDLSEVVRPRATPLLSRIETRAGERWVWTTFSHDQIDLDFSNPDVLLEFADILLGYITHGARIVRLDAIAYLWKRIGTACIHLPETHEVVKLLRDLVELTAPHVLLLTETNVPHAQNISYFGRGDEAHMVYNFSLPPLLLHALQTGSARHLARWAAGLEAPPEGCTYLNFTASHDGIGVRPLEGLLPKTQIRKLADRTLRLGGHVSEKTNTDGSKSPYELNITYFDAMADPERPEATDEQIARFLCSQTIMLALRGVPAVYFHSLTATANDEEGVQRRGFARAINRHKWDEEQLETLLEKPGTNQARVFHEYTRLLRLRAQQPAFHPDGAQRAIKLSDKLFAVERTAPDGGQVILSVSNVTGERSNVELRRADRPDRADRCRDLLRPDAEPFDCSRFTLEPYQTCWLTPAE